MKRRSSSKRKFSLAKFFLEMASWIAVLVWRFAPALVLIGLVVFSWIGICQFLFTDPNFQITRVQIFPKGILTSEEYVRLERECSSRNLLRLDLARVEALVKANPKVKQASVHRHLPSEVEILISPRKPLAQLRLSQKGEFYTIDDEGVVMGMSQHPDENLVQLIHESYGKKKLNLFDRYWHGSFQKVPQVLQAFYSNEVTKDEKIQEISIDHIGNLSILLVNGPELRTCDNASLSFEKLKVMKHLLDPPERSQLLYLDLCLDDVIAQRR